MRAAGMELLYHVNDMAVVGFTETFRHFRFFYRVWHDLNRTMEQRRPDLVILIDYPGFNLKVARWAWRRKLKVLYYIVPQVWAWGAGRLSKMRRWIDHAAVIFAFEAPLLLAAGIPTTFVGHPLLEGLKVILPREDFLRKLGLRRDGSILGLLPGSRQGEVRRLLPEMLRTAEQVRRRVGPLRILVACAPTVPPPVYGEILGGREDITLVSEGTYEVMKYSDALLVASGTATLEAACFETPMVVVYKVSTPSYFIAKRLVTIPNIALVNVVAGKRIVPEFVQEDFTAARVTPVLQRLLTDRVARQTMVSELSGVRQKLGSPGASQRAAALALRIIQNAAWTTRPRLR